MKKLPTRSVAKALALLVLLAAVAIGGLSLPWHGDRPAAPARIASAARGSGPLRAGAAAVNVDLPPGVPIGGFARLAWTSEGIRDPIRARALYLEVPGCRVAIASADVLLITSPLRDQVAARVADLGLDALVVTATHTHAGPGGYWGWLPAEHVALGPHDARIADLLATRIADAVRRAVAEATPARLAVAQGTAEPLVWSRSGGRVDARMRSLRITRDGGAPLAELLVFAAHPTTLGRSNRRISAEWPGRFAAAEGRGLRIVLQGPIGDQSAEVPDGDGATQPERYAEAVVRADDLLPEPPPAGQIDLSVATAFVTLPPPSPLALPRWLRRAAATLTWSGLPAEARVTALRVGPALLVSVPAEPTAELAARWRGAVGGDSDIVSLADGYLGYVETPERARADEGESVRNYYGTELGPRLEGAVVLAAKAVRP